MRIAYAMAVCTATFLLTGCATRMTVTPAATAHPKAHGLYYALPRTVIEADVTLARESFEPGVYATTNFARLKYAPTVLEITPVLKFSLGTVEITSRSEPDQKAMYFIEIPRREWLPFRSRTIQTTTSDTGLLSAATVDVADTTVETTISTITALTGLATKAAGLAGMPAMRLPSGRQASCDSWTGRDRDACEAYEEIQQSRRAREALVSGNPKLPSVSGGALERMLRVLNDDIGGRESLLFTGVKSTKKESRKFEFVPARENDTYDLFAFSEHSGVCNRLDANRTAAPFTEAFMNPVKSVSDLARERDEASTRLAAAEQMWRAAIQRAGAARETFDRGCCAVTVAELEAGKDEMRGAALSGPCRALLAVAKRAIADHAWAEELYARAKYNADVAAAAFEVANGKVASDSHAAPEATPISKEVAPIPCARVQIALGRLGSDLSATIKSDSGQKTGGLFYRVPGQFLVRVLEVAAGSETAARPMIGGTTTNELTARSAVTERGPTAAGGTQKAEQTEPKEHARKRIAIAQLGVVKALPEEVAGRNMHYVATLSPDTGALTNFVLNTKAMVDKETVTAAREAVGATIDAKTNAIRNQTERLTAQAERLAAEKALIDAMKALDAAKETEESAGSGAALGKIQQ